MILTATINEVKRRILFDNPQAVVAVKGDYEVNGIAFAFPAIYEDDFDLSTAVKTVYYKATDGIIYNHVVTATDTDTGYPLWVFKDEINKGAFGDVEFALVCDKVEGGNIVKRWVSMITAFRVQRSIEIDEAEQEDNEQTYSERLADLMTQMANMQATVSGLASGAPTPESLVANMQEGHVYIYTGTEPGYTAGHVYYYVGGTLTDGGVYGGTAVDATLTQFGQAADAKKTGDEISAIKEDLSAVSDDVREQAEAILDESDVVGSNSNYFVPSNKRESGITYTYDTTARSITAVGTATGTCFFNFCGGTSAVPNFIKKGADYLLSFETTDANINVQVTLYGTDTERVESGKSPICFKVPSNATGILVRLHNITGDVVNGTVSGFTYTEIVRSTIKPTGDTTDRTAEILYALTKCGKCRLTGGDYYIGNLIMPDNTTLNGDGDATRIYCTSSEGAGIEMGARCTVKDLTLYGDTADITLPSSDSEPEIGTRHGILLKGEDKEFGHISGCRIERFNGAGIIAYDTGTAVDNGFEIIGGFIRNCTVGIFSKRNAEFINIVGVTICRNWYGFLCRSGSNYCTNCYFLSNVVNAQIDNAEGSNGGHAAITGGVFGHANNNTGYALIIRGTGRMMITGANIYYGKLLLDHTNGNVISGCGFGSQTAWEINGTDGEGGCNLFIGCMLRTMSDTPITITDNTQTKIINCFTRYGNEVTV